MNGHFIFCGLMTALTLVIYAGSHNPVVGLCVIASAVCAASTYKPK
jgi:hypothetical protein